VNPQYSGLSGTPWAAEELKVSIDPNFSYFSHDSQDHFIRPDHQQDIICGVAFALSSLRRIVAYASVVAPRRLASNALLVIRIVSKPGAVIDVEET